jgi:hypothetical protein
MRVTQTQQMIFGIPFTHTFMEDDLYSDEIDPTEAQYEDAHGRYQHELDLHDGPHDEDDMSHEDVGPDSSGDSIFEDEAEKEENDELEIDVLLEDTDEEDDDWWENENELDEDED